jgi:hypothetical protein
VSQRSVSEIASHYNRHAAITEEKKAAAYTTIKPSFMKIRQLARVMFTQFIIHTETLSRLPTTLYNAHYHITHTTQHTNVTEHRTHNTQNADSERTCAVESGIVTISSS